jgi:ribosomal protein S15P/S13E
MDFKEIKEGLGDCDWMRAFLNGYAVDAVLWLMNRVEELEQHIKEDKGDKQCQ